MKGGQKGGRGPWCGHGSEVGTDEHTGCADDSVHGQCT